MLRDEEEQKPQAGAPSLSPSSGGDDDWETQEDPSARAMAALSVDAAAQAMGKMRIMQPPPLPMQDGGVYDRVLFDPSNAHAQPVSAATASAAAASALDGGRGPMDPVLVACLENPRERLTLLKFEDQIVRFIKNPREPQLVFPPLSSYHRLIIHRLAERCCLEHQTAEYNPYAGGYDGNSSRAVTLFRTSQSIVPSVLLIDLSSDRQQQTVTPATAPKIMMRKRGPQTGANGGKNPGDAKNAQRSMQDREKAYAEARARIFGEDTGVESTSSSASSNSSPSVATSANASRESSLSGAGAKLHNNNNQQAAGPDGSRGFGGRGRGVAAASGRGPGGQMNKPQQQYQDNVDTQDRGDSSDSAASTTSTGAPRAQSTKNWKESKVLWRNREQEMNDPDFTRNRDAYRPSRNSTNSGNANEYSRYPHSQAQQQQMGRYPAPQMDYYSQQQPPLPGRRFLPGGEYNRIDNTGMMRPPPPPDHFRSGGVAGGFSMNTPPPPPPPSAAGAGGRGGYGYNNSPHGRQYQHQHSSPSPVRGARNGGGYNDDFPPLGK